MRVLLTGKNLALPDSLDYVATQKFDRLARHQPRIERAEVELTLQATKDVQNHYVAQANLIAEGRLILRGEARAADLLVALDALVDQLDRSLERQHERVLRRRRPTAEGHLPPEPQEENGVPSTLASVLTDYGIDESTIARLQERGIHTMEQLRSLVDDGSLAPRLGPGYTHQTRDLIRVVEKLRL